MEEKLRRGESTQEERLPSLGILISTHNRCEVLKKCLDSIVALDYPKNLLELFVLDDASSDKTANEIPEYLQNLERIGFRKTQFFRNEKNLGIASGRWFLGQKVSPESEMVLFLDDDAYMERGCLKTLVKYLLEHPEAGIVGPRVVFAKDPTKTAHGANFVGGWTAHYYDKDSAEAINCDWVDPVCLLARSNLVKEIGGFWPEYYRSHEGVDFCLRIKKIGYQVVYDPRTVVQHAVNFVRPSKERLYYLYRNKMLAIHRNFPFFRKVVALSLIVLFGLPKYLLESIRFHKGFVFSELRIIFLSVWDGLVGKTGPRRKND